MALSAPLEMRQGQQLVMTPQLQQAIRLLQLSNIELSAFVEQELERNPLLEREDEPALPRRTPGGSPGPGGWQAAGAPPPERREGQERGRRLLRLVPRGQAGSRVEEVLGPGGEGPGVLVRGVDPRVEKQEPRAERLAGPRNRAAGSRAVGPREEDADAHGRIIFQTRGRAARKGGPQ